MIDSIPLEFCREAYREWIARFGSDQPGPDRVRIGAPLAIQPDHNAALIDTKPNHLRNAVIGSNREAFHAGSAEAIADTKLNSRK